MAKVSFIKVFNKIKFDFKVMHGFLNKNYICLIHNANVMYLIVNQLLVCRSPAGCSQASEGGEATTPIKFLQL